MDVPNKVFAHVKTILVALKGHCKDHKGVNKIDLQWNNNTLKVRHKELEVDTSLLVCTLHKPESCIGVHSTPHRI